MFKSNQVVVNVPGDDGLTYYSENIKYNELNEGELKEEFVCDKFNCFLKFQNQDDNEDDFEETQEHNQKIIDCLHDVVIETEYIRIKKSKLLDFLLSTNALKEYK